MVLAIELFFPGLLIGASCNIDEAIAARIASWIQFPPPDINLIKPSFQLINVFEQ